MVKEDLYKALIAARNGNTGELLYSESEARKIIDNMSDEHVEHISKTYDSADEWVDFLTM